MKKLKRPAPLAIMSAARFAAFMAEPVVLPVKLSMKPARRIGFGVLGIELPALNSSVEDRPPCVVEVNYAERYFENKVGQSRKLSNILKDDK